MKIVLSAFACGPGRGSEEGVGWGVASELAERHRVHVLTTPRFRAEIERHCGAHPNPNLSFSYHDLPQSLKRWIVHTALWQIYYYCWQRRIAAWAGKLIQEFDPDLIHHVTYGRYWTPTSLWKLGKPLIWGPLGGGDSCPKAFLPGLSWPGQASERVRQLAQKIARADPALKATARAAAVTLGGTAETAKCLRELGCREVEICLPTAADQSFIGKNAAAPRPGTIFCSVGRLLDWKGQAFAIRALASADLPDARLVILGEGGSLERLKKLADELGVGAAVSFLGNLPRDEVREWIERSVALVHPAIHDQSPTVVFEAMALATPVIGLALGGLPIQTTPECAVLIEAVSPDQVVADVAAAMRRLAGDPELCRRMGEAGQRRLVAQFTWPKKVAYFEKLYRKVGPVPSAAGDARVQDGARHPLAG